MSSNYNGLARKVAPVPKPLCNIDKNELFKGLHLQKMALIQDFEKWGIIWIGVNESGEFRIMKRIKEKLDGRRKIKMKRTQDEEDLKEEGGAG